MRRLALTVAILTTICTPAVAECANPVSVAIAMLQSRVPNLQIRNITGDDARRFVATFNAIEPVSDYKADRVIVFSLPGNPTARADLVLGGCIVHSEMLPAGAIDAILSGRLDSI